MFHSNLIFLLVPVLLPLFGAAGACLHEIQLRRRILAGVLLLEPIFAFLATDLRGSLTLWARAGMALVLRGDAAGSLFSVCFALLFCLTGFYAFEYLDGRHERRFFAFLMLMLAALQAMCRAGTGFVMALCFEGALAAGWAGVFRLRGAKEVRGTAKAVLLVLAGGEAAMLAALGVLAYTAGGLVFLPGGLSLLAGAGTRPLLLACAAVLAVHFGASPLVLLWAGGRSYAAPAPALVLLAGALPAAGLLAYLRISLEIFGAAALHGSRLHAVLGILALAAAVGCAVAACRQKVLYRRLALAVSAEQSYMLAALLAASRAGTAAAIAAAGACGAGAAAVFFAAGAFACKTGKLRLHELRGIGREMPVSLFCYSFGAMSLAGLPPFAGFAAHWELLASLPAATAAIPAAVSVLAAWYLLAPAARGFFPGAGYEPDMKVRAGFSLLVPLTVSAGVVLAGGLFAGPLLTLARDAAAALIV